MMDKTIGFIGGGRVTRIMLEGFKRKNLSFKEVVVSDINPEALKHLKEKFLDITIAPDNNPLPASGDIVFIALHPPVVLPALDEVKSFFKKETILISLAPKISISRISERLEGFKKIVRMIPNACSIVNHGFNPMAFSPSLDQSEKKDLLKILAVLGECPEVKEDKLEAYAILSAMGPAYLWFQLYEMEKIGTSFGLTPQDVRSAVTSMAEGAARTVVESDLTPEDVMDLIPVKPLAEEEETIKSLYRSKLEGLFKKLKA
ncbi:MAG: NAD(P)-binding domain-containing protein [Candidatus Aminicenantales bacterium]